MNKMHLAHMSGSYTTSTNGRDALCSAIVDGSNLMGRSMDSDEQNKVRFVVKRLPIGVVEALNRSFYDARKVGSSISNHIGQYRWLDVSLAGTLEEARSEAGRKFKEALGAEGIDWYNTIQNTARGEAKKIGRPWLQTAVGDAVGWCAMHNADVKSKGLVALGSDVGWGVEGAFSLAAQLRVVGDCDYPGREEYTRCAEMLVKAIQVNTVVIGIANGKAFAYGIGTEKEPRTIIQWWRAKLPPLRLEDRELCLA